MYCNPVKKKINSRDTSAGWPPCDTFYASEDYNPPLIMAAEDYNPVLQRKCGSVARAQDESRLGVFYVW